MPLYEYRCDKCGQEFEMNLRFSEADKLPACPKCKKPNAKKKISKVASFTVSGSGYGSSTSSSSNSSCNSSSGFT